MPTKSRSSAKMDKKARKLAQRAKRKQQFSQISQAIQLQRREDPRALWIVCGAFFLVIILCTAIGFFLHHPWLFLIIGILLGVLAAVVIFSRRARSLAYSKAEGQLGAAAWVLDNLRGTWRVKTGINATAQFDVVHRVLGLPGIILVGEGNSSKVKNLLHQEKRNLTKLVGSTPIYEVVVGNGTDQIPIAKLDSFLRKLPKNISREDIETLDKRLLAIKPKNPLPKGPLPQGAKIRGINRAMKRK